MTSQVSDSVFTVRAGFRCCRNRSDELHSDGSHLTYVFSLSAEKILILTILFRENLTVLG